MTAHPPGTIFVLRSSGFVSWSIRALTRSRSRVNHAGICLGDGHTVEAEAAGAIVGNERDPGPDITYGAALRDRIEARAGGRGQRIADEAQKLLGRGYNFADIAVLAWGNIRHDPTDGTPDSPNWWQRRVMDDQRLICSQLVDLSSRRVMRGSPAFTTSITSPNGMRWLWSPRSGIWTWSAQSTNRTTGHSSLPKPLAASKRRSMGTASTGGGCRTTSGSTRTTGCSGSFNPVPPKISKTDRRLGDAETP